MALSNGLALVDAPEPDATRQQIDAAILATIDAGVSGHCSSTAQRQDHEAKARLLKRFGV